MSTAIELHTYVSSNSIWGLSSSVYLHWFYKQCSVTQKSTVGADDFIGYNSNAKYSGSDSSSSKSVISQERGSESLLIIQSSKHLYKIPGFKAISQIIVLLMTLRVAISWKLVADSVRSFSIFPERNHLMSPRSNPKVAPMVFFFETAASQKSQKSGKVDLNWKKHEYAVLEAIDSFSNSKQRLSTPTQAKLEYTLICVQKTIRI